MSDTISTPSVAPPQDYPHDSWVENPSDEYHVPVSLRAHYAVAEPTEQQRLGYVQNGCTIVEDMKHEQPRQIAPGRGDGESVITYETREMPTMVDIMGASGYPRWLHRMRLTIAQRARRRAEQDTATEARYSTCTVCGVRAATVTTARVTDPTRTLPVLHVTGCAIHVPVLIAAARAAMDTAAAEQRLPDGRTVGDTAAQVVSAQLASHDTKRKAGQP